MVGYVSVALLPQITTYGRYLQVFFGRRVLPSGDALIEAPHSGVMTQYDVITLTSSAYHLSLSNIRSVGH